MLFFPLKPNLSLTIQFTNEIFFQLVGKVAGKNVNLPTSPNTKKEKYVKILIIIYVLHYTVLSVAKKKKKALREICTNNPNGTCSRMKKSFAKRTDINIHMILKNNTVCFLLINSIQGIQGHILMTSKQKLF